ncbi:MAG: hypothetical protein OJF47_003387 [Nitrospira sp.]|jgi:hypothetical protein|nr:MAG: hypothetical protein OJF47_003387 [Nitrospira sp.]
MMNAQVMPTTDIREKNDDRESWVSVSFLAPIIQKNRPINWTV